MRDKARHAEVERLRRSKNVGRYNEWQRAYRRRRRLEALNHYGGKCACCGISEYEFLSIDHINGGGTAHRRVLARQGKEIWRWLKMQGWPDGYQVLCHNCNQAKAWFRICPHANH